MVVFGGRIGMGRLVLRCDEIVLMCHVRSPQLQCNFRMIISSKVNSTIVSKRRNIDHWYRNILYIGHLPLYITTVCEPQA
jgi:hypothetical protein